MTEEEVKPTPTEKKSHITPAEAERRVSTAVAQVIPDESDSLLIEEDGAPFWVIQRVFWGILKTGALLALLLFLIWLVWRPSSFLGNQEPEFVFEPKPIEPVETPNNADNRSWWQRLFGRGETEPISPNPNQEPLFVPESANQNQNLGGNEATQIAYELETTRVLLVRGIIPESVQWLREAKTIGDISMQMLRGGTPQARSRQVEEILVAADKLFVQSLNLQIQLQAEMNYFLTEGNAANNRTAQLEQEIAFALQALDPVPVEALVTEKIASQQNASFFMSNAKIRDTLRQNIQTFDRLLRQRSIPLLNPATEIRAN